jgi:hypothetical protein
MVQIIIFTFLEDQIIENKNKYLSADSKFLMF